MRNEEPRTKNKEPNEEPATEKGAACSDRRQVQPPLVFPATFFVLFSVLRSLFRSSFFVLCSVLRSLFFVRPVARPPIVCHLVSATGEY
jgi:hypothetical protein